MLLQIIAGLAVLVSLLFVYFMLRVLWRKNWFLGCVRGFSGLLLLLASLMFLAFAWDIYGYKQALSETSIATLSFEQIDVQHYRVQLTDSLGNEQEFELYGDQWQLDAKLIKPTGQLARLGVKPAFRLERLSGRYFTLEDELNAPRSVYSLGPEYQGVDVWSLLKSSGLFPGWIDAAYGNAAYVPMEDGALYDVALTYSGLLARPLNRQAQQAVERWQ